MNLSVVSGEAEIREGVESYQYCDRHWLVQQS